MFVAEEEEEEEDDDDDDEMDRVSESRFRRMAWPAIALCCEVCFPFVTY